jgi:uncharacterized protein (DUF488 family)
MPTILTIGHSTRTAEEFIEALQRFQVNLVADIRTVPKSRHNPQFHIEQLPGSLASVDIDYRHLPKLGGLRKPVRDSLNTGWRNESFRGYADYMQTPAFDEAIDALIALAGKYKTVIMCSEAVFWRCHRALVADALIVRNVKVSHIMGGRKLESAMMTSFATPLGTRLVYPSA